MPTSVKRIVAAILRPETEVARKIKAVPSQTQLAYVATIPRSGTWMCHYLIEHFYSFIDPSYAVGATNIIFRHYPKINLAKLHVHTRCPGFSESYRGPLRSHWEGLPTPAYFDLEYEFAEANLKGFSPYTSSNARVVFLFRNPLDQAVSMFNHLKGHKQHRDYIGQFSDASEFLRKSNLNAYLKQYVSFVETKRLFPQNVLMLPYEDLYERTEQCLIDILRFLNVTVGVPAHQMALQHSIQSSSVDSMRKLERTLGHSLANDQREPGASHIKNGGIGVWRHHLSDDDVQFAESKLAMFGCSLRDFRH